jgi:hypothetical protein
MVETTSGKPLPHVELRVVGVGSTLTSDSGEFTLTLPPQFTPGAPLLLRVKGWVVIDPYEGENGKTYVRKDVTEAIKILVARKGDPSLLANSDLVQEIVQAFATRSGSQAKSEQDPFLRERAEELGFTLDQLKSAIEHWTKNVQGPYQKGLAALYSRQYGIASEYIRDSITSSESDLAMKYVALAGAEAEQAHYHAAYRSELQCFGREYWNLDHESSNRNAADGRASGNADPGVHGAS